MNNQKKGFTLTELLATIVIIGLIGSIGGYFIINTINKSENKSNELTINNIKTSANNYIKEYTNEIIWNKNINGEESSCISTNTLISKGYLKEKSIDINDNKTPKSIIVTRNENETIISEEEIYEDCNSYSKKVEIPTSQDICNTVTYDGNNHNLINESIDTSNYTIKYKDNNFNTTPPINAGNYKVVITLADEKIWKDNTTEQKEVTCSIKKAEPTLITYNSEGNISAGTTDAKIGTITIKVESPNTDGTISVKSSNKNHATASIADKNITKNEKKDININILATRDTTTYITITLTPKDNSNYKTKSIEYAIGKIQNKIAEKPTCNNLTYNGSEQNLVNENDGYTLLNNKGINYGKYTVTAILNYGFIWEDKSKETKTLECEIKNQTSIVTYSNATCDPTTKTVTYEDKYGTLCTPTKLGYTFDGWYTNTNYTTKITSESKVTNFKDHYLYAKWKAKALTVTFDSNYDGGGTKTQTFTYGVTNQKFSQTFTRNGYKLLGWSTSKTAEQQSWSTTAAVTDNWINTNSPNITLYAVWVKTLIVTFDSNYNGGGTKTQTFTKGVSDQKFSTTFTRSGYILMGWSTSKTAEKSEWSTTAAVKDSWIESHSPSITLYAVWMRKATHAKTNGQWNIWTTPGYVLVGSEIYTYTSSVCKFNTSDANIKKRIGDTIKSISIYVNVPVISKTIDCPQEAPKVFYKIYVANNSIHQNPYGTKLTNITDYVTISGTKYYGVWIAGSCTQSNCPIGDSLKFS